MALDVEEPDAARAAIMKSQIEPGELDEAVALTESETGACTLVWTAKEALSKALKCGLTIPFELLAVDRLERGSAYISGQFRNFGQYKFQTWRHGGVALTLVLPLRSELLTDVAAELGEHNAA